MEGLVFIAIILATILGAFLLAVWTDEAWSKGEIQRWFKNLTSRKWFDFFIAFSFSGVLTQKGVFWLFDLDESKILVENPEPSLKYPVVVILMWIVLCRIIYNLIKKRG